MSEKKHRQRLRVIPTMVNCPHAFLHQLTTLEETSWNLRIVKFSVCSVHHGAQHTSDGGAGVLIGILVLEGCTLLYSLIQCEVLDFSAIRKNLRSLKLGYYVLGAIWDDGIKVISCLTEARAEWHCEGDAHLWKTTFHSQTPPLSLSRPFLDWLDLQIEADDLR